MTDSCLTSNEKDNSLSLIYTYQDGAEDKSFLDGYRLQPIRVENSGDIYFMAYGYHSRGNHEGQVGVSSFIINVRQLY